MEDGKYGLIVYSSINIGDEIQSIASMRFLPHVDYYIHRERTDLFAPGTDEKVKLIMNAWWLWEPKHFPPSDSIDPLFVSFHMTEKRRRGFLTPKTVAYLKKHGPVGCRDSSTQKYFEENGIPSWLSGCLTATLVPNENLKEKYMSGYILCVDIPKDMVRKIQENTGRKVYSITNKLTPALTAADRLETARFFLFLYHNAYCVFTRRLHVSMPCTAFGTRVCLVREKDFDRRGRFDGMEKCFHEVGYEEWMNDPSLYDVNNPPDNPEDYLPMRRKLEEACRAFTGFDNESPTLGDEYNPLISMARVLEYKAGVIEKMCMFASPEKLAKTLGKKIIRRQTKFDEFGSGRPVRR